MTFLTIFPPLLFCILFCNSVFQFPIHFSHTELKHFFFPSIQEIPNSFFAQFSFSFICFHSFFSLQHRHLQSHLQQAPLSQVVSAENSNIFTCNRPPSPSVTPERDPFFHRHHSSIHLLPSRCNHQIFKSFSPHFFPFCFLYFNQYISSFVRNLRFQSFSFGFCSLPFSLI